MSGLYPSEEGVSEVVGELMLLFITVTLFAILTLTVYALMSRPPGQPILDVSASVNNENLIIQHMGGDSVPYGDLSLIIDGREYGASGSDANGNGAWDAGEAITVSLPAQAGRMNVAIYDKATGSLLETFTVGGL